MKLRHLLYMCVAGATAVQPALAHRMWLLPSSYTLSGDDQWITVDGAVSNDLFFPNHVPLNYENVTVHTPEGEALSVEDGWVGALRTTFDVHLTEQGTYRIVEGGSAWMAFYEEDGERRRMRGSLEELQAAGFFENPTAQVFHSRRNVEAYVTLGAPSTDAFATTDEGLELRPITHPNDVYVGEEASFSFVMDGAPAEGLEVEIVEGNDRYRDDPGAVTVTTDADGVFSFTPEEAGRYWISTSVRGSGEFEGHEIGVGQSYVVTFEALAL
ncbi:DUF4198 domain-containing protein [Ponticaulis sp.]|uniref:DUF4198 domain-containing protein n=1 Tax=Ponticaulis sp. TaxID=2020902 RepID=UPI000B6A86AF|nr:DUF4198 domain-containing protein [Ponticaulis sp.]MAI91039.1 ABC transporter permease [Ponticaulis sp.]OUX98373.1 MAG: ABC transporter permease [Hyphomonadaceae bacterium TMED5]|tara:strand:- start:99108 stop:99917 length:810 start_codon:yes stop_codon:yes gene_type:complete